MPDSYDEYQGKLQPAHQGSQSMSPAPVTTQDHEESCPICGISELRPMRSRKEQMNDMFRQNDINARSRIQPIPGEWANASRL